MAQKKKFKNASGLALACWVLGFLILLIVFLVKLDDIKSNLKSTRFFERVFGTTPTFIQNYEEKKPNTEPLAEENTIITLQTTPSSNVQVPVSAVPSVPQNSVSEKQQQMPTTQSSQIIDTQTTSSAAVQTTTVQAETAIVAAAKPDPQPVVATTTAKLYFVSIESDGSVNRMQAVRTVAKNDSPLASNVQLLLAGPSPSEYNKGCRSLIPEGTRLLSATVRDGVAFLNFSEEFEYNRVGVEGYIGQLTQIVYTATEFGTVKSVQFLIDGEKKEYLGSEGVWIGSPLSRSSFL